jgi:hypothetical protein
MIRADYGPMGIVTVLLATPLLIRTSGCSPKGALEGTSMLTW